MCKKNFWMFMYLLGLGLFFHSLLMFYFSVYFFLGKVSYLVQWELFMFNSFVIEMIMIFDWMTLIFLSVVFIISSMVMFYSIGYMSSEMNVSRFFKLLFMFVVSMVFLIISPSIMSILIGWDGLGLISYGLVIYYSNYMSYNFGMITFLCNRVGDVGILMMISLLMFIGSWNLMFYNEVYNLVIFFLVISSITKSAQIPFSSWLPKAMAAPTPVSSLVHSSTLVTAGVYLIVRYNYLLDFYMNSFLLIISSMTMFMAGIAANMESDLKKIVALSTLSQLGLMMSILSLGQMMLAFFHLLTHAMFKSLLFLSSGCIIHNFGNNQDIRVMGGLIKFMPFVVSCFFCASCSLGGFPFLSGFYSKDLIMEFMLLNNLVLISGFFLFFGTLLTISYSVRLVMFVVVGKGKFFSLFMVHNDVFMSLSMIILFILSIVGGAFLGTFIFDSVDLVYLTIFYKFLVIIICIMGVFFGLFIYYFNLGFGFNLILIEFYGLLWFVDKFMFIFGKKFFFLSYLFFSMEGVWFEYSNIKIFSSLVSLVKSSMNSNYNYLFSFLQYFFVLFIFVYMIYCID